MRLRSRSRSIALALSAIGVVGLAFAGFTALRSEQTEPQVRAGGMFEYSHCLSVYEWQDHWMLLTVVASISATDGVSSVEEVMIEIPDDTSVESVEVRVFEGTPFMTVIAKEDSKVQRTSIVPAMPSPILQWNSLPAEIDGDIDAGDDYTVAVVTEFPADGELNPEQPLFRATSMTYRDSDGDEVSRLVDVEQWISRAPFESDEYCTVWSREATG